MSNTIVETYQKKTDIEHILDAPDTYIGSIEMDTMKTWTFDETENKMKYTDVNWIPGLYKCFDEGIVNARDHYIRMQQKIATTTDETEKSQLKPVKKIDVEITKDTGVVSIMNDGNGIDVVKHPEYDLWVPEMIFGHLRTSTNYKKTEKKIVGGKNGFGFKLVLIYSKWGTIETVDHIRGLKYVQKFENNLSVIHPPKITKVKSSKPYTKVSWLPDYERFGMTDGLTDDMYYLFMKRVYDIAAVTNKDIKVSFNKTVIPIKTFEQYVNMYVGSKTDTKRIYEQDNERWEYAVCLTPHDEFSQVSFVNGINTTKGGKHVDYVMNQVTKKIGDMIEKKKKVKVKSTTIKEQLMIFVNCVVENPAFDSQTKDFMNTAVAKFGSSCKVSDKFAEKVAKLGVMDVALSLNDVKHQEASKKTDGKKTRTVKGIPKLIDANYAGTAKSSQCTLILCEGDSAKAGIVSGLSRDDRNFIGVYPLKGKLMNIRDASTKKINENKEITELKKILGLESNKKYTSAEVVKSSLRYGKVWILCDQDVDGSHIKGLTINMFDSQWAGLIKVDSFIGFMNTPIIKAKKASNEISFYNDTEYQRWKDSNDTRGWSIKYYKGLGTSTSKEFKEYFAKKRIVDFEYEDDSCAETLDMVFNKTRAEDRKNWLGNYNKEDILDTQNTSVSYKDFINKELIHFSKYDCERSIPNVMDGLKTSLRKILYASFKRNLTKEIKVAQFGGYVSEHSGYHHGEMSLMKAIVGMAQDFVGSNNINLLMPNGQFGTRLQGGDDSASERYIFTQLNPITRTLFNPHDDAVLTYLDDDGMSIEPEFYVPILPMILVNGSKGIGTGFSTDVMCYNPIHIMDYLQWSLNGRNTGDIPKIEPYYEGFKGRILQVEPHKFMFVGCYNRLDDNKIRITELPIGTWTENYKVFLEKMMDDSTPNGAKKSKKKSILKEYKDMSTDTTVEIILTLQPGVLSALEEKTFVEEHGLNMVYKEFNLTQTRTNTNMHLFDANQRLRKYDDVYAIIDEYMITRNEYYEKRKTHQLERLMREKVLLTNKARFIQEQCDDVIDLRRKKKDVVVELLKNGGYDVIDEDEEYKYLRTMPIDSVIEENITKLLEQRDLKMKEYDTLLHKTTSNIWMEELETLKEQYVKYQSMRNIKQNGTDEPQVKVKKTTKKLRVKKIKIANKKIQM
jgi:DNA topoisomerase-2